MFGNCRTFAAQNCLSIIKFLIALLAITTVISAFADEAKIDKESCTITKDGKTGRQIAIS